MASNLRVDTILPSSGTNVAIGTASGTVSLIGDSNLSTSGNLTIGGNLGVGGTLTYEDVTNIDSVGVITARGGIRLGATGANTLINGNATAIGIGTDFTGSQLWRSGKRLEIFGGTGNVTGELHLGANRGDGTQSVGSINFFDNTQDTSHKHVAVIEVDKAGSTSNKRGGDLIFYTKNDNVTGPTEKLRIDSGGNVTTPNNPAFAAKGVGGSWVTLAGSGDGTYSLGNTAHSGSNYNTNLNWASNNQSGGTDNRGSHWNNTAARFTAPVAGYYHFDINLYVKYSGQKTLHLMPYVGTTFTGTYDSSISTVVGGSSAYIQYPRTNRSINVYLTANKTFEWKVYSQTSIDVYPDYCWISGYLIG